MSRADIIEVIIKFAPERADRKTNALATLSACDGGAFVTVAEFKDARATLSNAIDDAFHAARDAAVQAGIAAGRGRSDILTDLSGVWYLSGLVSLAAANKRMGADEAIPADVRTVLAAAAELKTLIDSAKGKATPGRRPAEKTAPTKPRVLDMGTCAFCRRLQSVRGGMVEHGYTESRYGFRAGICGGTHIAPLEVGPDGLHALVRALEKAKARAQDAIDNPATSHKVDIRQGMRVIPVVFTSGPEFDRAARKALAEAQSTVRLADLRLPEVLDEITHWKPGKLVTAAEATARGI